MGIMPSTCDICSPHNSDAGNLKCSWLISYPARHYRYNAVRSGTYRRDYWSIASQGGDVVSLDDLVSEGVKIIENDVHQSNDKASHLRRFESSCPLRVSIIFFLKRRTIDISRGLIFVNNFTLFSQLRISECDKCENHRERVTKLR